MIRKTRAILPALLLLSACAEQQSTTASAQPAWPTPQQAAGPGAIDPVAGRLTTWLRLVGPTLQPAQDYADFLATRPVWPRWSRIEAQMQRAMATETDPDLMQRLCASQTLTAAPALTHCASMVGVNDRVAAEARGAWRSGSDAASDDAVLLATFGTSFGLEDHWARFDRQERAGKLDAATRTARLVSADRQALAQARLSLHRGEAEAEQSLAAVTGAQAQDPTLVLDHLRWLRKAGRDADAVALWRADGFQAETVTHDHAFWTERDALARELLSQNDAATARVLADDTEQPGESRFDPAFLTGWIALEQLHDNADAERHFQTLADAQPVLVRSRGFYWLGRTHAAMGDAARARADWQRAAAFPETFYGQMAGAALDHDSTTLLNPRHIPAETAQALAHMHDPAETTAQRVRFDGSELARAAQILVSWGDKPHARDFLTMLLAQPGDAADREALAALGMRLGIPDIAVASARRAGHDGVVLLHSGWPHPVSPPADAALPPGFMLGIMRQESSFNPDAVSPSGAVGLTQLMPGTAHDMVRSLGMTGQTISLHDPDTNARLGTAYLSHVSQVFNGVIPYAAAAYNAGPHRVSQWLDAGGDPGRNGGTQEAMIDWIEGIPYAETRNYVQRVWENMTVYAW